MIKKHWEELLGGVFFEKNNRAPPPYVHAALEAHYEVIAEWVSDPEMGLEMKTEGIDSKWVSMEVGSITFSPNVQYRTKAWKPLRQSEEV